MPTPIAIVVTICLAIIATTGIVAATIAALNGVELPSAVVAIASAAGGAIATLWVRSPRDN